MAAVRIAGRLSKVGGALFGLAAAVAAAAAGPLLLSQAEPGMWEVSRPGQQPILLCVADPAILAQFEHRAGTCERDLVSEAGAVAKIHYTCDGGGFGSSSLTMLTPRSLRVETQGISDNSPFKYKFQARRTGDC